jgi:hypothetical protein
LLVLIKILFGGASQPIATSNTGGSNNRVVLTTFLRTAIGLDEFAKTITSELAELKQDVGRNGDWIYGCVGALVATTLWILSRCEAVIAFVTAFL